MQASYPAQMQPPSTTRHIAITANNANPIQAMLLKTGFALGMFLEDYKCDDALIHAVQPAIIIEQGHLKLKATTRIKI